MAYTLYETNKTTTFKASRKHDYTLSIFCEWKKTSYGFKHEASLTIWNEKTGERHEAFDKACYYNRTWERFCFESVIIGAFCKAIKATKSQAEKKMLERVKKNLLDAVNSHKYKSIYTGN